jgi:hypothetical protein
MPKTENGAQVAALRELAGRLYRSFETRGGRPYWKRGAPSALHAWLDDVRFRASYTSADSSELCHVLYGLCGLILAGTGGPEPVSIEVMHDMVAQKEWSDFDVADLLRWLQDDFSRVDLVDDHLNTGGVLGATRAARSEFRRDMAITLLAALEQRAAGELAAWSDM